MKKKILDVYGSEIYSFDRVNFGDVFETTEGMKKLRFVVISGPNQNRLGEIHTVWSDGFCQNYDDSAWYEVQGQFTRVSRNKTVTVSVA